MLTSLIFTLALLSSVYLITVTVTAVVNKKESARSLNGRIFLMWSSSILWGVFYYLTH